MRPEKEEYYLGIALSVARRSPCLRKLYGAVLVKDDQMIGTGYNGPARGVINCFEVGCTKNVLEQPSYSNYEYCPAVHAEENAIINSNRDERIDSTLFLAGYNPDGSFAHAMPCMHCKRRIINAGITQVVIKTSDGKRQRFNPKDWIQEDSDWYVKTYHDAKRGNL